MNWKALEKTYRFVIPEVDLLFDYIDMDRGYFCGTHNYAEFYVVNVYSTSKLGAMELGHFGAFSGCYTGERIRVPSSWDPTHLDSDPYSLGYTTRETEVVFFRGKLPDLGNLFAPYDNPFDPIRHYLDHKCECPDHIKLWCTPLGYGGHVAPQVNGERLAEQMNETLGSVLNETEVACPDPGHDYVRYPLWEMVIHLNDLHKWSRERIADWLESSGNNPEFPVPDEIPKEPGEQ